MALVGTIAIAVTATTEKLQRGLNQAQSAIGGFAKGVMSVKGLIAGSFAGAGVAALGHFASLADDLSDNIEKLGVLFSGSADVVVAQAERMNAAFGTSEIAFTDAATKMGGLMKSLGVAEGPAAEMTAQLGAMGQAIANWKGIGFGEAMAEIQQGMAGKGKALKEFGISVNSSMTAQERFNAIMSGGADILGAMNQRAADAGNAWAEFRGRIEQVEIEIGKNLPEMIEPLFAELSVAVVAGIELFKSLKSSTLDWGESSLQSAKAAAEGMGWVQKAIGGIADAWQFVAYGFHSWQANFTGSLAMIVDALVSLDKWLEQNLPEFLGGGKKGENRDFLEAFATNLHDSAAKQFESLQKEAVAPLASEAVNAAWRAAQKNIEEARKEVTQSALATAAVSKSAMGAPKAMETSLGKSAGAALAAGGMGSASAIIKGQYQIGESDDTKKIAKNSDEQVDLLREIRDQRKKGDDNPEVWDHI